MISKTLYSSFVITLLTLIVLFLITCEKDPVSSAPQEDNYVLDKTVTIGTDGGKIELSNFVLTVPAGVFDSNYEIKAYTSSTDKPFEEKTISNMTKIEGFPENFNGTIKIEVKYDGTLSEESYISFGEQVTPSSISESINAYHLLNAADSSGWLIGELTDINQNSKFKHNKYVDPQGYSVADIFLGAVSGYYWMLSNEGHFYIKYPKVIVSESDIAALAGYFEEAYAKFQTDLGFDYSARTNTTIQITVMPFTGWSRSSEAFGYYFNSYLGNNHGSIELNSSHVHNSELIRLTAGHEFFHLVQSLYDYRLPGEKAREMPEHLWLNEAMSVWSEQMFTDEQNYISDLLRLNDQEPFKSMHTPLSLGQGASQNHGYGMVPMLGYIIQKYGISSLVKIYEKIGNGKHPIDAITLSTESPSIWLEPFLRDYTMGNIYSLPVGNAVNLATRDDLEFLIASSDDTLKVFSENYKDLSAKMYLIRLTDANMDTTASISFNIDNNTADCQITVFKYGSGRIEYIGNTGYGNMSPSINIPNVKKELMDNGWHLLAMVTNSNADYPYTGERTIDLTVRLKKPKYNRVKIDFKVVQNTSQIYEEKTGRYEEGDFSREGGRLHTWIGEFIGNEFSAVYDHQSENGYVNGTFNVELNQIGDMINNYSITFLSNNKSGTDSTYYWYELEGVNIPVYDDGSGILKFRIDETGTCNSITHYDWRTYSRYEDQWYWQYSDVWLTSYNCNANSYIEISFWAE